MKRWLSVKETAAYMNISLSKFFKMKKAGKIPFDSFEVDGKMTYDSEDVDKFMLCLKWTGAKK